MAAIDIFNPNTGYDPGLGFNANWNYGSPRKPGANMATMRPRFGPWSTRSVGGAGYAFDLTFVDRPIDQVAYIRNFYEQFQRGFFTLIDYDNYAREHVGRFTAYADDTHTANLKYTIRVTFEEIPGAPMRNYPGDFQHTGHWIYAVDDFLNPLAGTSGSAWDVQQTPAAVALGLSLNDPSSYEAYENAPVGDFAQVEYVGWGFQMACRQRFDLATAQVLLDGTAIGTVNLANGSASALAGLTVDTVSQPGYTVLSNIAVPLGRHRVKLLCTVAGGLYFPAMQVIH